MTVEVSLFPGSAVVLSDLMSKLTMNISSPSNAISSSIILNCTHSSVSLESNLTSGNVVAIKSSGAIQSEDD